MRMNINTVGPDFDSELRYFTRCCAAFELGPQSRRIDSVQVHLLHVHEALDRKDRHCVVEVEASDGRRIVARDADRDPHVAIYRALEGAGSVCARLDPCEISAARGLAGSGTWNPDPGDPPRAA